jgi:hypothetical protein
VGCFNTKWSSLNTILNKEGLVTTVVCYMLREIEWKNNIIFITIRKDENMRRVYTVSGRFRANLSINVTTSIMSIENRRTAQQHDKKSYTRADRDVSNTRSFTSTVA